MEFTAGAFLFHVHDHEKQVFLIERGELTIFMDKADGERYRLRRVGPGSLLGIAGFFRDAEADALVSAQAETSGRAFALSADAYERMKVEEPALAMAFQAHVLSFMSDRFAKNLHALEVVLRSEE